MMVGMEILFIASMSVIAADPPASRRLFVDDLGLPLQPDDSGEYFHSEVVEGAKHFGVWPLVQAAEACFGTADWPTDRPVPQVSVEFEVRDAAAVAAAERELVAAGHDLLHPTKTEPWGQTVARFQTADGAIVGLSYAPWLH
jgi:catechol 2,3-dioxygenase-like lactoylglutathione lyase family enzyme